MAGTVANADLTTPQKLLRTGLGVNLDNMDVSKSYLYSRKQELEKMMSENSVRRRLENQKRELNNVITKVFYDLKAY